MGCTFKARLNALFSLSYTWLMLPLQAYLLYLGFQRYNLYNDMKWPTGGYPDIWLKAYVGLYCACIPLAALLFLFGCFKSGNIAGDHEKLADREERIIEISRNRKGEKSGCLHRLKAIWQHSPPMPQLVHLVMAMCQLIAQQLMVSQLYRHGFINSGDFLNTEMDFVYQRARQLATNLPMGDTRLQGFRITAEELSGSPLAPNLLPVLMHVRLFGIPLEFCNLLIALVIYCCAYPNVFWRVSKSYALFFSFHMFTFAAHTIYSYLEFSIIFRIQETNYNSYRPVGLGQYMVTWPLAVLYHPYCIMAYYLVSFIITILMHPVFYTFGYNMYQEKIMLLQAKNHIRSGSTTGQSEYSNYTRKSTGRQPRNDFCCKGHGPHFHAIANLIVLVIVKIPFVFTIGPLFKHDAKPLLLSFLVVDIGYLALCVIMWLALAICNDWDFNVAHRAHQIYALQKGGVTGHIRGNENPSQLKNALIVLHRDHMFVTDDQAAKQSLLRHIQKGNDANEEFWTKQNGGEPASPITRKIANEDVKATPEMSRLMQHSMDDQSSAYQSVTRSQITNRGNSSPPENYPTLQRNQPSAYMSTLQRNQPMGTLQRSMPAGQWPTQQEAYASIHKQKNQEMVHRRGSSDQTYGQIENNYSNYGTYARVPNQTRIPVQPGQQVSSMRINGSNYGIPQGPQRRVAETTGGQPISTVRQSPLLSDRSVSGAGSQNTSLTTSTRDQSPYQRSGAKMYSFNQEKTAVYGNMPPSQWGAQRAPPGQPSQLLWNQNKPTMSASSSQQDAQCFTPTSTLTSQGSNSNYSNSHTPTPGSPQSSTVYGRVNGSGGGIYGTLGDEMYRDKTLQKTVKQATGSNTIRHAVKVVTPRADDSANYSLSSSNGSNDTARQNNDFATSIV